MGAILAILAPFIPIAITTVDKWFGPKTGPTKMSTVVSWLNTLVQDAQKAGVTGTMPTADQLEAIAEMFFQQMNATGQVNNPVPLPVAGMTAVLRFENGIAKSFG